MTSQRFSDIVTHPSMLIPGHADKKHLNLLIDISSIRSHKVIKALNDYFILGKARTEICDEYDVNQGYLSLKIKEIKLLNEKILNLLPYYI